MGKLVEEVGQPRHLILPFPVLEDHDGPVLKGSGSFQCEFLPHSFVVGVIQ